MYRIFTFLIVFFLSYDFPLLFGKEYFVSHSSGSDSNPGDISSPTRTIQKAINLASPGDIINISSGDYNEYIVTDKSGTESLPIVIKSNENAQTKAIRIINHSFITIDGLVFRGSQNSWLSHIRIEPSSSNIIIKNCKFGPGVYGVSNDFIFNADEKSVYSESIDFIESGFDVGASCFLGACGLGDLWFDNHDTSHKISSVSRNKLFFSTDLIEETKNPTWSPIFSGINRNGINGVSFIQRGGLGPQNCRISNCIFEDLFGTPIDMKGEGHEIDNNKITDTNGFYGIKPNGSNYNIHHNLFLNCSNFIFYTQEEISMIPHPPGSNWYDYQVGFIHAAENGNNIHFHHNWFENIEYRLGQISETPDSFGFIFSYNVFVGIAAPINGGRDGAEYINNTFYKVGYDYSATSALAIGGNNNSDPQDSLVIMNNIFVDCGSHWKQNEGSYKITEFITREYIDKNFISQFETNGYLGEEEKNEPNGINGGDPLFLNQENPLGRDGVPFTEDDGLRPLPNSIIAQKGWGALPPADLNENIPIAHFNILSSNQGMGWKDITGYEYDLKWLNSFPYERKSRVRPYFTPENLGSIGVSIVFNAENSISSDDKDISFYEWKFNEDIIISDSPTISYTFLRPGINKVSLKVINSLGNFSSIEKTYKIINSTNMILPPFNLKIIK